MGVYKGLSNADKKQLELAIGKAGEAWRRGYQAFVYKPTALASLDGDALSWVLDRILAIGWQLHSTALAYNSTAMNKEVAMFTFVRPDGKQGDADPM